MAFQGIVTGFTPNDGQGDTLLAGAIKTNDNFRELYEALGDGTSIGIATLTQLKLSGILTATSLDVPNINVSGILTAGTLTAANVQVSGVVTANSFSGDLNGNVVATSFNSLGSISVGNQVRITSTGALQNIVSAATSSLTVTGDSTLTNVTAGVVTATSFNGSFNGSFTGNSIGLTGSPDIEVGIVTANTGVGIGTSVKNALLNFPTGNAISNSDIIQAGTNALDYTLYALKSDDQHVIRQATLGNYTVSVGATNQFTVSNLDGWGLLGSIHPGGVQDSDTAFVVRPDTSTELRYNYDKKFETTGVGVTVFGTTETDTLNVSGVATAAGFVGPLTGDATGLSGSPSITVTNITASGNVSIAGTLTYEDVTNIDAIGLITARSGVQVDSGGIDVTGVSTFQNDVAFGEVVSLGDYINALGNLRIGDDGDLRIHHNGSNSFIRNATGSLYLSAQQDNERVHIQSDDGSGGIVDYFAAYGNTGEARLYHYGNQKLATKSNGIDVTGHTETDTLNVSGVSTLTGQVSFGNTAIFGDDDKILMGDGQDLEIFHASNNSYIRQAGTGHLYIRNLADDRSIYLQSDDGTGGYTTYLQANGASGNVQLFHYGSQRFATRDYGIEVTGHTETDTLNVSGVATASEYRFPNYGSTNYTRLGSGQLIVSGLNDKGSVQVGALTTVFSMGHAPFNNNCYFSQTGEHDWVFWSGLTTTSMTVNGGISTRPHSVTLRKLYVDTNADIDGNLSVSGIATLGSHALDANDFKVGTTLNFKSSDGSTNILTLNQSGSVDLYHNTNKKFETTVSGVEVTGGLVADNLSISGVSTFTGLTRHVGVASFFDDVNFLFDDSTGKVTLGPNNELEIFHANATGNSVIKESGSGSLILAGDNVVIRNSANNETKASFISDGASNLFFNNGKKFETTGIGASVLGTLEVFSFAEIGSGLNVSGVATATTFNGALHGTALLSEGLTGTPDITVDDITAAQINVSGLTTTTNKVEVRSTDSTPGRVDLFCEVSNAHYARLQAPFHSAFSGNVVATLPTKSGNLIVGDSAVIDNDINTSGIITASSFSGSGSNLTSLTGASAGSYGGGFVIPVITVDANGRITGISTAANAGAQGGGGGIANVVDDTAPQLGGTLDTNGNLIQFGDSSGATDDRLQFGASQDLQIYHDSNNSIIEDTGTGFLGIRGESLIALQSLNGSENYAIFNKDGAVELYHNNSQKFRTLSTGATITGTLSATSFSGDGSNLTGIVTSLVAGSNVTLGVSGGRVTINASGGGGGGGGTGINVQNNGVAIGSTTTQTINFNDDLEATVNGSVVTVNSTAPSQATAIALAIALG